MSCGRPHEKPCSEVLEEVYLYLDAECDQVSKAHIKQHLHECTPCLQEFGIEQEVKALVHRCCGDETAPDGLRERLRAKLREVVVTSGVESAGAEVASVQVTSVQVTSVQVTSVEVTSVEVTDAEIRES